MGLHAWYDRPVPEVELLGRIMGPDRWHCRYVVTRVEHIGERTRATFLPIPSDEPRVVRDTEFGQEWLTPVAFAELLGP